jgi:hypothetical protein
MTAIPSHSDEPLLLLGYIPPVVMEYGARASHMGGAGGRMESEMDDTVTREEFDAKLERTEARVDASVAELKAEFSKLESGLSKDLSRLSIDLGERLGAVDRRIADVDRRLGDVDHRLADVDGRVMVMKDTLPNKNFIIGTAVSVVALTIAIMALGASQFGNGIMASSSSVSQAVNAEKLAAQALEISKANAQNLQAISANVRMIADKVGTDSDPSDVKKPD